MQRFAIAIQYRRHRSQSEKRRTDLPAESTVVDVTGGPVRFLISPLHKRLGHDDHTLPGYFVLFQKLAQDSLRIALGVGIGRVERLWPVSSLLLHIIV